MNNNKSFFEWLFDRINLYPGVTLKNEPDSQNPSRRKAVVSDTTIKIEDTGYDPVEKDKFTDRFEEYLQAYSNSKMSKTGIHGINYPQLLIISKKLTELYSLGFYYYTEKNEKNITIDKLLNNNYDIKYNYYFNNINSVNKKDLDSLNQELQKYNLVGIIKNDDNLPIFANQSEYKGNDYKLIEALRTIYYVWNLKEHTQSGGAPRRKPRKKSSLLSKKYVDMNYNEQKEYKIKIQSDTFKKEYIKYNNEQKYDELLVEAGLKPLLKKNKVTIRLLQSTSNPVSKRGINNRKNGVEMTSISDRKELTTSENDNQPESGAGEGASGEGLIKNDNIRPAELAKNTGNINLNLKKTVNKIKNRSATVIQQMVKNKQKRNKNKRLERYIKNHKNIIQRSQTTQQSGVEETKSEPSINYEDRRLATKKANKNRRTTQREINKMSHENTNVGIEYGNPPSPVSTILESGAGSGASGEGLIKNDDIRPAELAKKTVNKIERNKLIKSGKLTATSSNFNSSIITPPGSGAGEGASGDQSTTIPVPSAQTLHDTKKSKLSSTSTNNYKKKITNRYAQETIKQFKKRLYTPKKKKISKKNKKMMKRYKSEIEKIKSILDFDIDKCIKTINEALNEKDIHNLNEIKEKINDKINIIYELYPELKSQTGGGMKKNEIRKKLTKLIELDESVNDNIKLLSSRDPIANLENRKNNQPGPKSEEKKSDSEDEASNTANKPSLFKKVGRKLKKIINQPVPIQTKSIPIFSISETEFKEKENGIHKNIENNCNIHLDDLNFPFNKFVNIMIELYKKNANTYISNHSIQPLHKSIAMENYYNYIIVNFYLNAFKYMKIKSEYGKSVSYKEGTATHDFKSKPMELMKTLKIRIYYKK